jgi:hypothetical protein
MRRAGLGAQKYLQGFRAKMQGCASLLKVICKAAGLKCKPLQGYASVSKAIILEMLQAKEKEPEFPPAL